MLVVSAKLVAPWLTTAVDGHGELSEPAAVLRKAARRWLQAGRARRSPGKGRSARRWRGAGGEAQGRKGEGREGEAEERQRGSRGSQEGGIEWK